MRIRFMLAMLLLLAFTPLAQAADKAPASSGFFLHNGDTVVFYGDSITEQQMYARDIEDYVVTRFPKMRVNFINSGWGGDRVTGGGGGDIETRLKRDVLPYKPTVVTIFLGMNDAAYRPFDEAIFQTYAKGMTHIVDELQQKLPKVRLTLLTPSMFDKDANKPSDNPYNQTLIKYGDFVKQLGAQRGIPVVDLNAPMVAATAQGRMADPGFTLFGDGHHGDGVHPDEIGHLIMAAAVLTTWNAPGLVADLSVKPDSPLTVTTPLPWPVVDTARQAFAISPLPGALNVYRLHADNLPAANYTLVVDGKDYGSLSREQLQTGVDLTQNPDLPFNQQAQAVAKIIQDRINKWHNLYKGGNDAIAHASDQPSKPEANALLAVDKWLDGWRDQAYAAAQPKPHTFSLRAITP